MTSQYRNNDVESLKMKNMKATMNDNLSDNTFDMPKRSRVQSAYIRPDRIEEIQEEAFDSINIKTVGGGSFIEHEQEESA
jgi:hypothetical protein